VQPFYFGTSQKQLFGVYHAPEARAARQAAFLLCQPLGHEYLRAHRAFRNLAVALAGQGFHVLRFDYFGCGDSGGDDEQATVEQCLLDLSAAIDELKDTAGAAKVSLIGLRFGATLAAVAASRRTDIDRIVLWDPVLEGRDYLDDLRTLHVTWLKDRLGAGATHDPSRPELLGCPLTAGNEEQIAATSLTGLVASPGLRARGVWLMVSEALTRYETLHAGLAAAKVPVAYKVVPGEGDWDRVDLVHQTLLPHAMVRAITAAMAS
jgi:pimeloyl-ACP methyl ester carboxylesterase